MMKFSMKMKISNLSKVFVLLSLIFIKFSALRLHMTTQKSRTLWLDPIKSFKGEIEIPGSKSISNRILLLSAVSKGATSIHGLLRSDDVDFMLKALKELNVSFIFLLCCFAAKHIYRSEQRLVTNQI